MAKRNRAILVAGIAILTLPLLWAATLPGVFVGDGADLFSYQMPMRDAAATALRHGELFAWNPWLLGGVAAHAGMQLGLLYPPNVALALVTGKAAILPTYVLHLLLLGAGGAVLARVHLGDRKGATVWPQLASAAVWVGSGVTWGHLWAGHVSLVEAWALWPWLWAAVLHAWRVRTAWSLLVASAVIALQVLAGHPQTTFLCAVGLLPLLLAHVVTAPEPVSGTTGVARWPGSLAALALLVVAGLFAALLAAAQLLPTAAIAESLNRSLSTPQELAMAFSAPARSLVTALSPHVWGGPGRSLADVSYHESLAWIGATGLALSLLGALRSGRRGLLLLCFAGFFVLLSLGKDSPLLGTLVDLLPGFGAFRVPSRWLLPAVATLALLVADGLADSSPAPTKATGKLAPQKPAVLVASRSAQVGSYLLFALSAVPALLALQVRVERGWWADYVAQKAQDAAPLAGQVSAELFFVALLLAVAGWLARAPNWHPRAAPVLAALAVLEAAWFGGQHVGAPFQRPEATVAWSAEEAASIAKNVDGSHRLATAAALRQANFGGRASVRIAGGYEPTITREANWYGNLLAGRSEDGYSVNFQVRGPSPWLDRLAVSHVLIDPRDPSVQRGFSLWPIAETLSSGRQLRVNPRPMPRLGWAQTVVVDADAKAVIARLPQTPPETTVLSEALPHTPAAGGAIQLGLDLPQRVEAQVTATAATVLVLRDAFSPGWTATLDGKPAPLMRADGFFRALSVPAGAHQVVWQFEAPGLGVGSAISGLSWLAWIVAAIVLLRRKQAF